MTAKKQSVEIFYPHPRRQYAWSIWIAATLFLFFLFLIEFSMWNVHSPLISQKLIKPTSIQTILTPYLLATILFQLPIAFMIDEWGPTIVIGSVMLISTIGILLLGLSYSFSIFWFSLFITGIGTTITYSNVFKFISNWFSPRKFPLIAGGTVCLAHIGAAFAQPLTEFLLSQ